METLRASRFQDLQRLQFVLPVATHVAGHSEILPIVRVGCDASRFDQYSVTQAFGVPHDWNRQLPTSRSCRIV
jgi:hypothetical protein